MVDKKKAKFVLVEFVDPSVLDVLERLRALLGKRARKTGIHITIRGPYKRDPKKISLSKMEERIRGEPLLITGAGRFLNGMTHIVYLKVGGKFLKELWWKPDYPTIEYGFNPHVTIYEGEDEEAADLVFQFLKKEKIELLCFDYVVRLHDRGRPLVVHAPRQEGSSVRWGKVAPGMLDRAAKLSKLINLTARQKRLF